MTILQNAKLQKRFFLENLLLGEKRKKKGQTVVEGAYFRFKIRRWNIIYIHCACKHTFIWGRSYLPTINTQNIITNNLKYMRIHIYMMCYPISLSFFPVDNLYSHHWNTQFCSFFLGPMYLVLILKNNKNIPVVNQLHSQDQYTIYFDSEFPLFSCFLALIIHVEDKRNAGLTWTWFYLPHTHSWYL